jgi:hypothetical protein
MIRALCVAASALGLIAGGVAAPANADNDSDQIFSHALAHKGLLFNFPLEKYQGQRYCQSVMQGEASLDAVEELMRDGSYSFDVANWITSSAMSAYCLCAVSAQEGVHADPSICRPFELSGGRDE